MKIIFTSCTRYEAFKKQPQWNQISRQDPDYLFLLGDNIYMDYGCAPFSREPNGAPEHYSNEKFEKLMTEKYHRQFCEVPEFKNLVEKMRSKNGFFGIWDDHDFAWNNATAFDVPKEKEKISRKLFHQYLNCSTNLPHTYYHIDTPVARVLFLDNRSGAEPKGKNNKLLSNEQFSFIESKLNHHLKYTILCGGLTLTEGQENWTKYPSQLRKLCKLIQGIDNLVFLGGDIHKNKFVKPKRIKELNVLTPVQLISSGMQVNYLGLGIPQDDQHNWAMLDIDKDGFRVSFYNKRGLQKNKSVRASEFIKQHFQK